MRAASLACAASAVLILAGWHSVPASALATPVAVLPQQESYFPPDAELRKLLRTLVDRGEARGIVLGLLEPDGRRRVIAFGEAGPGAPPLSSRTGFEIGSITKTFINAILADMVRRGEVSLDDPVSKFLPAGVTIPSRNGRQITLVDLATHVSGLPRNLGRDSIRDPSNPYAAVPIEEVYAFLASHELQRDIGADWEYSNLGVALLGHALTRAAGEKTMDELIRKRITGPLQMNQTGFDQPNGPGAAMAKGHDPNGKVVPYWSFGAFRGAGGLVSNAEDMLTFLEANVGTPESLLQAALRDTHQPRRSLAQGSSIALGWQHRSIGGRTILHHSGSTGGFGAYLGFDPATKAAVVVLGNSRGFDAKDDVVLQLLRSGRPDFRVTDVPPGEIAPLLGEYAFEGGDRRFFARQGKLFTRLTGGRDMEVFPAGKDRFFYGPGTLGWFEVKRDSAGKHVMLMYQGGLPEASRSVRVGPGAAD